MPKLIVYHRFYGCDTGCCGHAINIDGKDVKFVFEHPEETEDTKVWAKELIEDELGKEHGADLDWEHCEITADCE